MKEIDIKNLSKLVKKAGDYTPDSPPKKPDKQPNKSELNAKFSLNRKTLKIDKE